MTKQTLIALGAMGWLVVAACTGGSNPPPPPPDPIPSGSGGSGGNPDGGGGNGGGTGGTGGGAWVTAVGDRGSVLQTFDDRTWSLTYGSNNQLDAVACVGNQHGWTVGAAGTVLYTIDSGHSWSAGASNVTSALHGVRFASFSVGWAVGDAGTIIVSRDGG